MGIEPWITYTVVGFCGLVVAAGSLIAFKVWRSKQKPDPAKQTLNRFLAADGNPEPKDCLSDEDSPSTVGYGSDAERRQLIYGKHGRAQGYHESSDTLREPRPAYMKQQQRAYSPASSFVSSADSPPIMPYAQGQAYPYDAGVDRQQYAPSPYGQYPQAQPPPAQLRGGYWA